jgi:hypothetical protein
LQQIGIGSKPEPINQDDKAVLSDEPRLIAQFFRDKYSKEISDLKNRLAKYVLILFILHKNLVY